MTNPKKSVDSRSNLIGQTLDRLLASLLVQLQAMTRDTTPESVHQSRIAIRRLRVALRAMQPYLLAPARRLYASSLRSLMADLENSREAEIRAACIALLIGRCGDKHPSEVNQLLVIVAAQRARAARQLKDLMAKLAWRRRLSTLQGYSRVQLVIPHVCDSVLLVREALARHEHHLQRSLRHRAHKPRKLHRLRLRIKAARYLEEDFLSVRTVAPDRQLKRLRRLQEQLGDYHDNWRVKKWLKAQSAFPSVTEGLCNELSAQQKRLLKSITRLTRRAQTSQNDS